MGAIGELGCREWFWGTQLSNNKAPQSDALSYQKKEADPYESSSLSLSLIGETEASPPNGLWDLGAQGT